MLLLWSGIFLKGPILQQITANKIVFGPWKSATLMSSVPPSASFLGSTVQRVCRSNTLFRTSMLSDVTKGIDTPPHISRRLVSTHSARCHNNVSLCFCVSSFKCVRKRASEFARSCKQRARYVFFSGDSLSFIFFKLIYHTWQLDLILGT